MDELFTSAPNGSGNVQVSGALVARGDVSGATVWSPDSARLAYRADQETDQVFELFASPPNSAAGNVKLSGTLTPPLGNVLTRIEHAWHAAGMRGMR